MDISLNTLRGMGILSLLVGLLLILVFFFLMKRMVNNLLARQSTDAAYQELIVELCIYFLAEEKLGTTENKAFEESYDGLILLEFNYRLQFLLYRYDKDKKLRETEEYEHLVLLESFIRNHQTSELMHFVQEVSKERRIERKKSRRTL